MGKLLPKATGPHRFERYSNPEKTSAWVDVDGKLIKVHVSQLSFAEAEGL